MTSEPRYTVQMNTKQTFGVWDGRYGRFCDKWNTLQPAIAQSRADYLNRADSVTPEAGGMSTSDGVGA